MISETTVQIIAASVGAIALAVPPTILAIANLRQSRRNAEIAKVNDEKTDTLVKRTDEIHAVTNSAKEAVDKQLKLANRRIAKLEKALGEFIGSGKRKQTS